MRGPSGNHFLRPSSLKIGTETNEDNAETVEARSYLATDKVQLLIV